MNLLVSRHAPDDERGAHVNSDVAGELLGAGEKSITGSIDVMDKCMKTHARLYLYDGGLYAIDLEGYSQPVFARLHSSGLFSTHSDAELAMLARLDIPDPQAVAQAVDKGWVSIEALANVHQEMLLAALGSVLALPKAKARTRKGETSSRFCTLPLPVDTLVDTVCMRADRMQGTWAMSAPGASPGDSVLRHASAPLAERATSPEVGAMAREIDGVRTLDAIANALGFTRAEAVHVASALIRSGMARVDVDVKAQPAPPQHLVPESFGTHRIVPGAPVEPVKAPAPPVARATVLPVRPVDDVGEHERRLTSLRRDVVARLRAGP